MILSCLPVLCVAETSQPPNPPPASNELPAESSDQKTYFLEHTDIPMLNETLNRLDDWQKWVGSEVEDLGQATDNFFGTEVAFEQSKGNRLDISFPFQFHQDGQIDQSINLRAKIDLPRTNKKWQIIVTSAEQSLTESLTGNDNTQPVQRKATAVNDKNNSNAVGLRFLIDTKDVISSFVGFGVNFRNIIQPDPYARIKGNKKWLLSPVWTSRMSHDLFWESVQGVGLRSTQTFDANLGKQHLFRSETIGTWLDKEQAYDIDHNFILFDQVNVHRGLAYHLGWSWTTKEKGFHLSAYHAGVNWRERVYKRWLFVELEPRVDFSESNDFKQADFSILLMLEAQFYKVKP
ncbi:hypothetical protein CYQ88_05075 [Hydrogenovibrio sp. SC-1]|uniref:hypothetical protein n=1 Tax=Hydrogenovibrio sp. SC-1 TaxID=2065820 RepID=UPI000C7C77AB|nr:hypothetical protein [Hydrogenovibrio sp. SC-1]PLA74685.1 hypothetical protein CYQ88_05075 [Hydrogenovibrio sp. SC-1]